MHDIPCSIPSAFPQYTVHSNGHKKSYFMSERDTFPSMLFFICWDVDWLPCYGSPSTWLGPCRVHPCRRGISLYRDTTLIQPYFREFDKYFNIQIFWAASPFPLLYWELRTCQGETLARVRENDKRVHPYTAGKQNCSPWFRFQSQMGGWIACGQAKGFCSRPRQDLKAGYGSALGRDLTKSKKVQILSTGSRVSRGAWNIYCTAKMLSWACALSVTCTTEAKHATKTPCIHS